MSLKVIGVGGPRTGTASLKVAFETLGFGKCYHMERLFNHPEELKYWHEMFETGETDFDNLFDGFQSTVDFPGYMNFKALYKKYPEAKFVLTERDAEEWYESAIKTVYAVTPQTIPQKLGLLKKMIFNSRFRKIAKTFMLAEKYLWKVQYQGQFKNKAHTIQIYNDFNEQIKDTIPAKQLLIANISEGWKPLCDFLKVPIPKEDFPFKNKRHHFQEQFRTLMSAGGELVLK